jgi:hypothetical protein
MSPSTRFRAISKWAVVPVALMASGLLVWQSSYSAFSATTVNPTNNWTAGTVALTDDDTNTALFTASTLKPGDTGTKCIVVTSSGNLASAVKLYQTGYANTAALGTYLNMVIDEGTGGTYSSSGPTSCTGFTFGSNDYTGTLAGFSGKTSFATGAGTWAPAAGTVTKTYRFSYTLDAATPNTSQGGTASVGFTWEAQNS